MRSSKGDEGVRSSNGVISFTYPILTKSNYAAWAIKMKVYMKAQGVWEAIEDKEVNTRKDQMALATIYQGISDDTLLLLAEKETAKEAWEMLKTMHLGAERVKEARIQTLKCEFENLRMMEAENVDDFAARLTTVVNKIRALGEKVEEANVVKKLLRVVPSKFVQIAAAIEQFGDLKTMTIEDIIGRLKTHEERIHAITNVEEERVFLSRAKDRAREARNSWSSPREQNDGKHNNQWCGRERNNNNWRDQGGFRGAEDGRTRDKSRLKCFHCQRFGHYAADCRFERRDKSNEEALLIGEQEEPISQLL